MANIDNLLNCLDSVRKTGSGRWLALCPVHKEKTPSLTVRLLDNDSIICHCFGCGANGVAIIEALGIELDTLFPEREHRPSRAPFPAADILKALYGESLLFSLYATAVINGSEISAKDHSRAMLAARRIGEAVHYAK